MKIKIAKTAYCGYLYSDGHAVVLHREKHAKAGEVEWAEIWEKVDVHLAFDGRIVFHNVNRDLRFKLACEAYEVRAGTPSTENGSENTKRMGLQVGSFTIAFKDGTELYWVRTPDIISDSLTYQPDAKEAFDPEWTTYSFWGASRIGKIHHLPKTPEQAQVAA